jgi:hypothetical protein
MIFMPRRKDKLQKLGELERAIVKQASGETSEDKLDELEEEVDEEIKEPASVHEGMGIEKEEKQEGEPYPEIEKALEHEDEPDKADEEEEEEK